MKRHIWILAAGTFLAFSISITLIFMGEFNRRGILSSFGSTTTGRVLCAQVGMTLDDTVNCLSDFGYSESFRAYGGQRQFLRFDEGKEIAILNEPSWRKSTIYLQLEEDETVSRIDWRFDLRAP